MINEHKKGVKAMKYTAKAKNPVAKAHQAIGSGSGMHKDKKRAEKSVRGQKHKEKDTSGMLEGIAGAIAGGVAGGVLTKSPRGAVAGAEVGDKVQQMFSRNSDAENESQDSSEYDDEAGMADNNLETLKRAVEGLDDLISAGDNLPEWCQEKIAVAKSMLVAVWDYMQSEEQSVSESGDPLQNRADYAKKHGQGQVYKKTYPGDKHGMTKTYAYDVKRTGPKGKLPKEDVEEDWQKVNKHDKTDGMSSKAVKAYRRENPGSKLKTAVTKKPSELKAGSKDAKRRKSFCARMSGVDGPMKDEKGRPTAKAKALSRWNCESVDPTTSNDWYMLRLKTLLESNIKTDKKK